MTVRTARRTRLLLVLTTTVAGAVAFAPPVGAAPTGTPTSSGLLAGVFDDAAARYDIPRDLLMALGTRSRAWTCIPVPRARPAVTGSCT
ncbi:hypothetical protein NKG94_20975 [Micromonospora sp. M12]